MSITNTVCVHHWIVRRSGSARCRDCGERNRFDPTPPPILDLLPMFDPAGAANDGTYNVFDPAMVGLAVSGGPRMNRPLGAVEPFEVVSEVREDSEHEASNRFYRNIRLLHPHPPYTRMLALRKALRDKGRKSSQKPPGWVIAHYLVDCGATAAQAEAIARDALLIERHPDESWESVSYRMLRATRERLRYLLLSNRSAQ